MLVRNLRRNQLYDPVFRAASVDNFFDSFFQPFVGIRSNGVPRDYNEVDENETNKQHSDNLSLMNFQSNNRGTMSLEEKKEGNGFLLSGKLSNIDPTKLKTTVKDGVITVSGEKVEEDKEKGFYSSYSFRQSFQLPKETDLEKIDAVFKEDQLTIDIPLKQKEKEKVDEGTKIPIELN